MAVVFDVSARNRMLESLKTFKGGTLTTVTGMMIIASSSPSELTTKLANAVVTYGTATGGQMSINGTPFLTVPAGSTVASLFLATYQTSVDNTAPIGYRTISPAQVFETAGTITITGSTISIVNPT